MDGDIKIMNYKAVLFDLDGTLLPMDQDQFTKEYFKRLAIKLAPHGYEADALFKNLWAGVTAMILNDGSRLNEEAFWDTFCQLVGKDCRCDAPVFDSFYRNEFSTAKKCLSANK